MSKILLSIHPEFVEKILSGEKKYEFRTVRAKRNPKKILIYSTSPVSMVIGEAEVENILVDHPQNIWEKTYMYSGIDEAYFKEYFKGRDRAIAYELTNIVKYKTPKTLKDFGINMAPQSFVYVH